MFLKKYKLAVAAFAFALSGVSANAVTLTIEDIPMNTLFGELTYSGNVGDILGFYTGGVIVPPADAPLSDAKAERYASGNNAYEESLVQSLTGLAVVSLGGSELTITSNSATVAGNTYFTTKFAQSVAVFWNTTDSDIVVTFDDSNNTCTTGQNGNSNECGGISHFKAISDGTFDPPGGVVPLPAGLPLLLSALGFGGLLRLRKRKAA